jgi:hypothetical protein
LSEDGQQKNTRPGLHRPLSSSYSSLPQKVTVEHDVAEAAQVRRKRMPIIGSLEARTLPPFSSLKIST